MTKVELSAAHQRLVDASDGIPKFLLVKNRRPLSSANARRLEKVQASLNHGRAERVDWRKPKGTSWEEWDAYIAKRDEERHAASIARITAMREKMGLPPPAPSVRRTSGDPPAGSKTALIADLMMRPDGCTTADVLAATGWPAVSMPAQARAAGLALRKERVGGVLRYYGTKS